MNLFPVFCRFHCDEWLFTDKKNPPNELSTSSVQDTMEPSNANPIPNDNGVTNVNAMNAVSLLDAARIIIPNDTLEEVADRVNSTITTAVQEEVENRVNSTMRAATAALPEDVANRVNSTITTAVTERVNTTITSAVREAIVNDPKVDAKQSSLMNEERAKFKSPPAISSMPPSEP